MEAPSASSATGVRIRVEEGPVTVSILGVARGTRIEVSRADVPELSVFAPEGSRFRSGDADVEVVADGGPIRVELPVAATPATLRVDGRTWLLWTDRGPDLRRAPVERSGDAIVFEVDGP
jgi:hypothetical protein